MGSVDRLQGVEKLYGMVFEGKYRVLRDPPPKGTKKSWIVFAQEIGEISPGRIVALKVLKPGQPAERITQLKDEIRTLAELGECKGTTAVYGGGREGDHYYIAMEALPEDNLQERITRGERFTLEQIVNKTSSAADTLLFCHQRGIEHNDIKLKNLIEVKDRKVVIDFGSKFTRDESSDDVYALATNVLEKLLEHGPDKIPRELERIILKAKKGSYSGMKEFARDLDRFKGINRRRFIQGSIASAMVLSLGALALKGRDYLNSIGYIKEKISGTEDPAKLQRLFTELEERIFLQKTIPEAEGIPSGEYPFGTIGDSWYTSGDRNFTNGYWPGILWEGFIRTNNLRLRRLAEESTSQINISKEDLINTTATRFFCSHAKAYDITKKDSYKVSALGAIDILKRRFDERGFFAPFIDRPDISEAGVMMDIVPFFLWGFRTTSNREYLEMARSHVDTAVNFHIRDDGSVRKTAVLDGTKVIGELNDKGIGSASTFARAQAQMMYGMADFLSIEQDPVLIKHAKRVADYFLRPDSVNERGVHYADLEAKNADFPTDTSASAIALQALNGLSKITEDSSYEKAFYFLKKALTINYLRDKEEAGIIGGACESFRRRSYMNSALVFGDYYFLNS